MNPNTIDSIIKQLIASHTTISTMESCTSGLIASLITDTEGASAIFPGGYVTYLNETKVLVGVDPSVIEIHGVYSPECAAQYKKTCTPPSPSESPAQPEISTPTTLTAYRASSTSVFYTKPKPTPSPSRPTSPA